MSPNHRFRRNIVIVGLILLASTLSVSAQEDDSRDGNSPLSGGEVVISAGVGIHYYAAPNIGNVFSNIGSRLGASANTEFVIGRTSLSDPIDLTFGAGAAGNVAFGDPVSWSAGAFATARLFLVRNLGTYSRLGLGYFHWGTGSAYLDQFTSGVRLMAAGGLEYFIGDQFAIYLEAGWILPLTLGVRVSL